MPSRPKSKRPATPKPKAKAGKKPSISAFFPAYNEEANIGPLCVKTAAALKKVTTRYEVIAINDGSKDDTAGVVNALHKKDSHIRLVSHKVNQGYGAAVKTGFASSKMDWIFFTDGDGQFDVNEISRLLPLCADNDLVVGYRVKRADAPHRLLNAWLWGTLVRNLFGLKGVRDIDCAFKLIRRDVFKTFKLETTGAMISTELLVKSQKNGFRITEIGVGHYPRTAGEQTGAKLSVIARAFKELFRYYFKWQSQGYK
jgi:glycosyltransferase involved in cell wall biosynthesis